MFNRSRLALLIFLLVATLPLVGAKDCSRPFILTAESPGNGSVYTDPGAVTFIASMAVTEKATPEDQIVSVQLFEISENEFLHRGDLAPMSPGRFSYDWNYSAADNGLHRFIMVANDQLGGAYYSGLINVTIEVENCSLADGGVCILDDVNEALNAWQIGLPNANVSSVRSSGSGSSANPRNWISVGCEGPGLSEADRADCLQDFGSGSNTIGTCSYWYSPSSGEILSTTTLLRESYLTGSSNYSDKLSVIIHEIGHCIGLKHWPTRDHVMYGSTAGADLPAPGELAAVAEAYVPSPAQPSPATRDAYFNSTGSLALRQLTNPQFTLDATFAGGTTSFFAIRPAPGEPLPPDAVRVKHEFDENGDCTVAH